MGWEHRPGGTYFYKAVRIDGLPRKLYIGKGDAAVAQARQHAARQQHRQAERESFLADRARLALAETALDELWSLVNLLARATLLTWGYHQHHGGEWRRRTSSASHDRAGEDTAEQETQEVHA